MKYRLCSVLDIHGEPLGVNEDGEYTDVPEACPVCFHLLEYPVAGQTRCIHCGLIIIIESTRNSVDNKYPSEDGITRTGAANG